MEARVKNQLEFYLSDRNLSRDIKMKTAIQQNGGLTLDFLMECNMINRFVNGDRTRLQEVLGNIKSDVFEVNDGANLVNRRDSLPVASQDYKKEDLFKKTVHMNGFPLTATQVEINEWVRQFGSAYRVYLKFYPHTKRFDGSAYVTFDEQHAADSVVGNNTCHFHGMPIKVKYPARGMKDKIMARLFS